MSNNNDLKPYYIKELLENHKYVIPIYQRKFAWGVEEISQFITDISDYANENEQAYYIGTLIVDKKDNGLLEIIDGQQRLTTLYILLSLIKNEYSTEEECKEYFSSIGELKLNLTFDSRPKSTNTLKSLYDSGIDNIDENMDNNIIAGYEICKRKLAEVLREKFKGKETEFFEYLFKKVKILQVPVLKDTNLNHYFEIMNSRGEQLEMHEILKANCLSKLNENDRKIFNLIWEACSDTGRYIQFGFEKSLRDEIFGKDDLNTLINSEELYSEKMYSKINNNSDNNNEVNSSYKSIGWIVKNHKISDEGSNNNGTKNEDSEASEERFNSVINFPNFLLQVLKIQKSKELSELDKKIPLDDKKLLTTFKQFLGNDNDFVKTFGYNLLKIRFLFDKYIIKNEFNTNKNSREWSLKKCSNSDYSNTFGSKDDKDENKTILMLLSMFHVSYPGQAYKNWLYDALSYLYGEADIKAGEYKNKLKKIAREYYNKASNNSDNNTLDNGTRVPHFIFNYLDYLLWELELWKEDSYNKHKDSLYLGDDKVFIDKIKDFKFTFRSSVEHYYPQNPIDKNYFDEEGNDLREDDILNKFGNLCLIGRGENSKLNNHITSAKKDYYRRVNIDSVKQTIMMSHNKWGKIEIEKHGKAMKNLIAKNS